MLLMNGKNISLYLILIKILLLESNLVALIAFMKINVVDKPKK